ncbi:MAG: thiosulfate dehydrogenase (quinone) large subunit [Chloroflexota bacterium]|jgi:thiosulfate dehydrogenase [quinone] large subunit|nr:thiosulfate dehydrogenase (quinone) large subunit [Chloroflexota bacterium]
MAVTDSPIAAVDWDRGCLETLLNTGSFVWFARVVTSGEVAIGVALLFGTFTGGAAFAGAFMNWSYLTACTASRTQPHCGWLADVGC